MCKVDQNRLWLKSLTKPNVKTQETSVSVCTVSIVFSHKAGELIEQLLVLLIGPLIH